MIFLVIIVSTSCKNGNINRDTYISKEEPDISVKRVTKIVNGGQTDIERREELYKKCCEKIKE